MKIIFLDIDGVMNSFNGIIKRGGQALRDLHEEHFEVLKWIIQQTNARIVISSTWRIGNTLEDLKEILNPHINSEIIIDKTPNLHKERGNEIQAWLDNNSQFVIESFVILDDDSDMVHLTEDHLVQTKDDYGLTYIEGYKAICHLNNWWWYPNWSTRKDKREPNITMVLKGKK